MKTKQGHTSGSKEHASEIEKAVGDRHDLVHAKFLYGCQRCKTIEPIYLGVGVEGPSELREKQLYIPSPFGGPQCRNCGGETSHVFFGSDEHFEPRPPPDGARYFCIPKKGINMKRFCTIAFAGAMKTYRADLAKRDEHLP